MTRTKRKNWMRTTFNQITELLRGQEDIVILTHKRPDGDTLG